MAGMQGSEKLTYSNQLEFKAWAKQQVQFGKNDFYFDYITGVNAKTGRNIAGLDAGGDLSWDEALDILKAYFKLS